MPELANRWDGVSGSVDNAATPGAVSRATDWIAQQNVQGHADRGASWIGENGGKPGQAFNWTYGKTRQLDDATGISDWIAGTQPTFGNAAISGMRKAL